MAIIVLIKGTDGDSFGIFFPGKYILGRSSKSDIVIKDSQVSGKHCCLESTDEGRVIFSDIGSTNGSFLENSKISSHELKVGETIRIGNTLLSIDESSLTIAEKNIIGKIKKTSPNNNLTLPSLTKNQQEITNAHQERKETNNQKEKNNAIEVKNKSLLKGAPKQVILSEKEQLIEQEESSGNTKLLKLNRAPIVKRKK